MFLQDKNQNKIAEYFYGIKDIDRIIHALYFEPNGGIYAHKIAYEVGLNEVEMTDASLALKTLGYIMMGSRDGKPTIIFTDKLITDFQAYLDIPPVKPLPDADLEALKLLKQKIIAGTITASELTQGLKLLIKKYVLST